MADGLTLEPSMNTASSVLAADQRKADPSRKAQAKIAHTIPEAVVASGLSRSMLYVAISRGTLHARKCGARTVILDSDLRRFLLSLPRFAGSKAPTTATEPNFGPKPKQKRGRS